MSQPEHFDESPGESPTWFSWALLVVFSLIGVVAVFGVGLALSKLELSDPSVARSVITVVFTIGTMAIAIILVLAVLLQSGRNVQPRFTSAKEVLTILIGILGTIVGFYFGQAAQPPSASSEPPNGAASTLEQSSIADLPATPTMPAENGLSAPANLPLDPVPTILEVQDVE